MSDIVVRLRNGMECWRSDFEDLREAADEILRLRAEVEKLRGEVTHWRKNHDHKVEQLRLFKQREDLPVDRLPAYRRLVELQAENEKLRAALKPFAETDIAFYADEKDYYVCTAVWFSLGQYRAAATALKENE